MCVEVSILTRSEERVQLRVRKGVECRYRFQSSPAPKSGCNLPEFEACPECGMFQSSPAPKSGCNWNLPGGVVSVDRFQSSPAPKSGCNWENRPVMSPLQSFNPHPLRRAGATKYRHEWCSTWDVSILTRSEERVQHGIRFSLGKSDKGFQSSPAPKSGCNYRFAFRLLFLL